jgi:hypothetical protein
MAAGVEVAMTKGPGEQGLMEHGVRLPLRPGARPSVLIEHPDEIPLQVRTLPQRSARLEDPGLGGVRFAAREVIRPGTLVEISARVGGEAVALRGLIVAWMQHGHRTRLEMAFMDQRTAFEGRMYEQACHIEAYRLRRAAQGRALTVEQAAQEWISRYSATFPGLARSA